jgi:hypothetical protein
VLDDERAGVQEDRRLALNVRNSLTVILPVLDAAACRLELERQRLALEHGWAKVPGLVSACLALLPAETGAARAFPALLLECSFETEFADLMFVWFMASGQELSAVLGQCAEYPESADARLFADYLGSRARRSSAFAARPTASGELEFGRSLRRVFDALRPVSAAPPPPLSDEELEARRLAVGMQEPIPGVPLVHVAWLAPGSRTRLKRALRELEHEPPAVEYDARFLLDGARLVFVAYPNESAPRWSERLSQIGLAACARVWRNCRGFSEFCGVPRARRARRLQEFVLEHRIPVAAWFNARAPSRGAEREN